VRAAGSRSDELADLLVDSQKEMARFAFDLLEILECPLWVSGIGELRPKGIFRPWAEELRALCLGAPVELRERVWLFRHFSMNQFAIEYANARMSDDGRPKRGSEYTKGIAYPEPGRFGSGRDLCDARRNRQKKPHHNFGVLAPPPMLYAQIHLLAGHHGVRTLIYFE
jgi:hypothetical protein